MSDIVNPNQFLQNQQQLNQQISTQPATASAIQPGGAWANNPAGYQQYLAQTEESQRMANQQQMINQAALDHANGIATSTGGHGLTPAQTQAAYTARFGTPAPVAGVPNPTSQGFVQDRTGSWNNPNGTPFVPTNVNYIHVGEMIGGQEVRKPFTSVQAPMQINYPNTPNFAGLQGQFQKEGTYYPIANGVMDFGASRSTGTFWGSTEGALQFITNRGNIQASGSAGIINPVTPQMSIAPQPSIQQPNAAYAISPMKYEAPSTDILGSAWNILQAPGRIVTGAANTIGSGIMGVNQAVVNNLPGFARAETIVTESGPQLIGANITAMGNGVWGLTQTFQNTITKTVTPEPMPVNIGNGNSNFVTGIPKFTPSQTTNNVVGNQDLTFTQKFDAKNNAIFQPTEKAPVIIGPFGFIPGESNSIFGTIAQGISPGLGAMNIVARASGNQQAINAAQVSTDLGGAAINTGIGSVQEGYGSALYGGFAGIASTIQGKTPTEQTVNTGLQFRTDIRQGASDVLGAVTPSVVNAIPGFGAVTQLAPKSFSQPIYNTATEFTQSAADKFIRNPANIPLAIGQGIVAGPIFTEGSAAIGSLAAGSKIPYIANVARFSEYAGEFGTGALSLPVKSSVKLGYIGSQAALPLAITGVTGYEVYTSPTPVKTAGEIGGTFALMGVGALATRGLTFSQMGEIPGDIRSSVPEIPQIFTPKETLYPTGYSVTRTNIGSGNYIETLTQNRPSKLLYGEGFENSINRPGLSKAQIIPENEPFPFNLAKENVPSFGEYGNYAPQKYNPWDVVSIPSMSGRSALIDRMTSQYSPEKLQQNMESAIKVEAAVPPRISYKETLRQNYAQQLESFKFEAKNQIVPEWQQGVIAEGRVKIGTNREFDFISGVEKWNTPKSENMLNLAKQPIDVIGRSNLQKTNMDNGEFYYEQKPSKIQATEGNIISWKYNEKTGSVEKISGIDNIKDILGNTKQTKPLTGRERPSGNSQQLVTLQKETPVVEGISSASYDVYGNTAAPIFKQKGMLKNEMGYPAGIIMRSPQMFEEEIQTQGPLSLRQFGISNKELSNQMEQQNQNEYKGMFNLDLVGTSKQIGINIPSFKNELSNVGVNENINVNQNVIMPVNDIFTDVTQINTPINDITQIYQTEQINQNFNVNQFDQLLYNPPSVTNINIGDTLYQNIQQQTPFTTTMQINNIGLNFPDLGYLPPTWPTPKSAYPKEFGFIPNLGGGGGNGMGGISSHLFGEYAALGKNLNVFGL
jgi:hypothetical protein